MTATVTLQSVDATGGSAVIAAALDTLAPILAGERVGHIVIGSEVRFYKYQATS